MSVRVFRIPVNHHIKILNCFFMVLDHLISLCTLMHKSNVCGDLLDTATKRENCLFKFFDTTVCQTQMIEDVRLISEKWLVLQGQLECFYTLFVLLVSVVRKT
jgi:hypothetical protein